MAFLPIHSRSQPTIQTLPEMGDSSATLLSQKEELRIGSEMMQQLQRSGMLLKDAFVNTYIERLGRSLATVAVTERNQFRFFVVDADSINAFAMPGGYIGVHSGLILASESESELAAVLAHEIAHVTQHHIARSVEKAGEMNLPITAAVIAAILLGGGDPQVANAALAASIGGSSQMQLDFSRANEKEADRVGMQLLASSNYDPAGMSNFFGKLLAQNRYYGSGVPEFLRTHPVTTSRIAEAEDRARQYQRKTRLDSIEFHLAKARLRLERTGSLAELQMQVEAEEAATVHEEEAKQYLLALLAQHQGQTNEARKILTSLLKHHPGRIAHTLALAELEASEGQYRVAAKHYQNALEHYPGNRLLTLGYAEALMATGEHSTARYLLEQLLREQKDHHSTYRLLAKLEAETGNVAASYLARAEYLYLTGELHSAIDQLNIASRLDNLPHYFATRIDARLEKFKAEATHLKRSP